MVLEKIRQICQSHGGQCGKCPLRNPKGSICGIPGEMSDEYIQHLDAFLGLIPLKPRRKLTDEDVEAVAGAVFRKIKKYLDEE